VEFTNADLTNADFGGAYLVDAVFTGASMAGARFQGAYTYHTNFRGAELAGADFTGVPSLGSAYFDSETTYDPATVFPAGFDPAAQGLTLVPEPSTIVLSLAGLLLWLAAWRRRRIGDSPQL